MSLGAMPVEFLRPHIHELDLAGAIVIALQGSGAAGAGADGAAIDDVGVIGLDRDEAALAGSGIAAITERDGAPVAGTGHRDGRVVLLRGEHAVRIPVVGVDTIELRRRLIVDGRPGDAAVE